MFHVMLALAVILMAGVTMQAHAQSIPSSDALPVDGSTGLIVIQEQSDKMPSPRAQWDDGVPLEQIKCDMDKILMQKGNKPICVSYETASKLVNRGYTVIEQDIQVYVPAEPILTTLQVASTELFVDDGREYPVVAQRRPPPNYLYDEIMTDDLVIPNPQVGGTASFSSPPHEKYSKNEGIGLYLEDWMPTHIVDGHRLLYADAGYVDHSTLSNRATHTEHYAIYYFAPNDYVLSTDITDRDILRNIDGYRIGVVIDSIPVDEIEDAIERLRNHRASQGGDYSEFRDLKRDGKTVFAYQGGNNLNYYTALVGFNPDEYTTVHINSDYHTLDELIPVFESMLN